MSPVRDWVRVVPVDANGDGVPNIIPRAIVAMREHMAVTGESVRHLALVAGVPRRTTANLLGGRIPGALFDLDTLAKALGGRLVFVLDDPASDAAGCVSGR